HDVKAAIRFLRVSAARWNINPDRIGVWGHSAGGHLAALAALTPGNAELEGDGGYPEVSRAVQAAALSPPTDLVTGWAEMTDLPLHPNWIAVAEMLGGDMADPTVRDRARQASPVMYATASAPPLLVVRGTRDDLVPVSHGRSLVARLREVGADARLIELPEDGHTIPSVFGVDGVPPTPVMERIVAFFEETLGPVPAVA
ncbi:MAG: prolyl oligopeptidase family serine peptidase, partial [Chloroflexota bacterium]|nr:prolyl oligopeptidase family serine peptidase [Chloroflexota bacterium]